MSRRKRSLLNSTGKLSLPQDRHEVRREGGRASHEAMGLAGSVLSLGPLFPQRWKGYGPVGEGSSPSAVEVLWRSICLLACF